MHDLFNLRASQALLYLSDTAAQSAESDGTAVRRALVFWVKDDVDGV